jgi:hypothetical protein
MKVDFSISFASFLISDLETPNIPGTSGITRVGCLAANLAESGLISDAKIRS